MKDIMISIKPEWCEKIASGKKTVEVRKTRPRLKPPFQCYIYCTKSKTNEKGGKVIGEFVCDAFVTDKTMGSDEMFNTAACMTGDDVSKYAAGSPVFGWHISNLIIYDVKSKESSSFLTESNASTDCPVLKKMTRPPQSWCYVEELERK